MISLFLAQADPELLEITGNVATTTANNLQEVVKKATPEGIVIWLVIFSIGFVVALYKYVMGESSGGIFSR